MAQNYAFEPTGQKTMADSEPVVIASDQTPVPISGTVVVTPSGTQDVNVVSSVEIEVKNDAGNPLAVSGTVAVSNFPATQPVSGTVAVSNFPATQNVSVTNGAGASAVNIQDGGNSITVDGTVTTTPSGVQHTIVDSGTLTAVTAITNALPTGTNALGTIKETWGTTSYAAGTLTSGSKSITGTLRSLRIFAQSTDGTFNIGGGDTVTVRSGTGFDWSPTSTLTNPTINWVSGTLDYFVEFV